jgi:hypothetical protein
MEEFKYAMYVYLVLVFVFIGLSIMSIAANSAILPINVLAAVYFTYRANVMRSILKEEK